jgi:hypothetical protein
MQEKSDVSRIFSSTAGFSKKRSTARLGALIRPNIINYFIVGPCHSWYNGESIV